MGKRVLLHGAVILAFSYLMLCIGLFFFQEKLIYFPQPRKTTGLQSTTVLPVDGATLIVTTKPKPGSKAIVYFGGNAEDVSGNLATFSASFPDHALYLLHYRSYGGSSGAPSETAIRNDALVLFDKVREQHSEIIAVGRSLGSGVAVRLASERPVSKLVLITPYNSIEELASNAFPYMPIWLLLKNRFDSSSVAPKITIPTTIIAAEHDETIPSSSTEKLLDRFPSGVAVMKVIPSTGHNTISGSEEYLDLIKKAL